MGRALIADDHEVTRRGVSEILREVFPELAVEEAPDGPTALTKLGDGAWDLVLLDVMMPGMGFRDLLQRLRALHPEVPVLVLTAATEPAYVIEALRGGASGVVHKARASDVLIDAVRVVLAGERWIHPDTEAEVAAATRDPDPHDRLSPREADIFRRIARGEAVKAIAADLGLSDKTVATYVTRIREKTGLSSYVDIARYALLHHLVD